MTTETSSFKSLMLWCAVALPLIGVAAAGARLPAAVSKDLRAERLLHGGAVSGSGSFPDIADPPAVLAGAPVVLPGLAPLEAFEPMKTPLPPAMISPPLRTAVQTGPLKRRQPKRRVVKRINKRFQQLIHQAATRHRIEPAMIKAIIMAESGFNPNAVSNRGARGLMQLMPQTAEALGVADVFDPHHNIDGGVRYFRQLLNHFQGDVTLALAAYNAGLQKVLDHNGVPPFKSTQRYVEKVLTYYEFYKQMVSEEERRDRRLS